ncbi:MAG: hypothetical protein LBT92_04035 [Rickettsiales bacterium]|jgi:hypothetical protein|nr:hypothetical protein [Rickettsiales bacterium]
MKKLSPILLCAAACALIETRTAQTFYTPIKNDGSVSAEEIGDRIFKSAERSGWNPRRDGKGRIIATHTEDRREVRVAITYTDRYYTIEYKASFGMDYDEKFRTANADYNEWVGFLNHTIAGDMED